MTSFKRKFKKSNVNNKTGSARIFRSSKQFRKRKITTIRKSLNSHNLHPLNKPILKTLRRLPDVRKNKGKRKLWKLLAKSNSKWQRSGKKS
jgi:hypothetical protein